MTTESELQNDIMTALLLHKRVAWALVVTTGKFKVKGGYTVVGHYATDDLKRKTGASDILGQLTDGRLCAIEIKKPGEFPTKEQRDFIDMVNRNGGLAGYVTSINEAYELLDSLSPQT